MRGLDRSGTRVGQGAVGACAITVVVLLALVVGCEKRNPEPEKPNERSDAAAPPAGPVFNINGKTVKLNEVGEDGTISLLSSVTGDLNEDGRDDRAVVLKLDSRGTGVFYYLNAFLRESQGGWRLVGEEFLGDRIRFDYIQIYGEGSPALGTDVPVHPDDRGTLVVAFFIHGTQPLSEPPDLYLTRHWRVEDGKLVLQDNY